VERDLVEQYRARAQAERASAAAFRDPHAAEAAYAMANSFDRVADAYERLMETRESSGIPLSGSKLV
jgi:hypothetical protein